MFLTLCSSNPTVKQVCLQSLPPPPPVSCKSIPKCVVTARKHSFLRQINKCVDRRGLRTLLNKTYTKTQNAVGNPAYDALMMFKILLGMAPSNYEVEERINDSILFSEFLGLDMGVAAPDHSTISRFRLELTRLVIMDKLLERTE